MADTTVQGDGRVRAGFLTRLYTGTGAFDVVGKRKLWYALFGTLVLVCIGSIVFRGFNLGIDFTGGTQVQFPAAGVAAPATVEDVRGVYEQAIGQEPAAVQTIGQGAAASVLIRSEPLDAGQIIALRQALFDHFQPVGSGGQPSVSAISITDVSGTWGGQITRQALIALAVFLVLVTIFLAFYFERAMAVAALVALVHDVVVTMGVYSLVGFEVTPATAIGLLTILGFSLYDTVVVFDKVKENTRGLLGLTLNQTLMRSINTSLIAVLPVVGLMVVGVGLLGVGTLADLALVQIVGILAGAASSVLLATPILVDLKQRDPRIREQARRVAARRARLVTAASGEPSGSTSDEPDLSDEALAGELRRERAMAAASGVPARTATQRPTGKGTRPTGKRRR